MRRFLAIICTLLPCAGWLRADETRLAPAEWAIEAQLPGPPDKDVVLIPSPQGDVRAARYFLEQAGEHFLLARFTYPLALEPDDEAAVYEKSITDFMHSRPGVIRLREPFQLGPYTGWRLLIAQTREKTLREVRLIVIGTSLYVFSAEWPEAGPGAGSAAHLFTAIRLQPGYDNLLAVEQNERWRELRVGNFRLRYDAAHWYRDPSDQEAGVFNFLRRDRQAEAQFIAEPQPVEGGDIEAAVLKTARDGADSVTVKKNGKKYRGTAEVTELQFAAHVEGATYINHGYFYSGPAGTVQLRGWARDKNYADIADDITELLDGLTVGAR